MNNKKGISLIVLVITILVMIILAGVVIVSLQNDNPINKAKFAKMVDSVQSVRGAISQYTVTSQANSSDNNSASIDILLAKDKGGNTKGDFDKTSTLGKLDPEEVGYLILDSKYKVSGSTEKNNGKTVKELLGVDPSQLSTFGYFVVNRTTGASEFVLSDSKLAEGNVLPDGIVTSQTMKNVANK